MLIAMTTFPNDGRKLKNLIQWLIKSWIAACINRINYVKSYYIRDDKLMKEEEKILLIKFPADKKKELTAFIKKNHPYKLHELIFLKPDDVDEAYLTRVKSVKPFTKNPAKKWDKTG